MILKSACYYCCWNFKEVKSIVLKVRSPLTIYRSFALVLLFAHLNTIVFEGANEAIRLLQNVEVASSDLTNSLAEFVLEDVLDFEDHSTDDDEEGSQSNQKHGSKEVKYCQHHDVGIGVFASSPILRKHTASNLLPAFTGINVPPPEVNT